MHKIDRKALEAMLAVRLSSAIKANKHGLLAKLPLQRDAAIDAVVADLIDQLDNDHTCVVQTEMVHSRQAPGKFGEDEPWPAEITIVRRMSLGTIADDV